MSIMASGMLGVNSRRVTQAAVNFNGVLANCRQAVLAGDWPSLLEQSYVHAELRSAVQPSRRRCYCSHQWHAGAIAGGAPVPDAERR
jgi:hypothetical protein